MRSSSCCSRPRSRSRRRTSPELAIDAIQHGDSEALLAIVALFVVAGLGTIATSSAQTYFTGWTGERILADLRNKLFRHLQRLSLGYYERNRAGVIISRLTNDVEALDQLVTDGVTTSRPELADPDRHRDHSLLPRLATRARDDDDPAAADVMATALFRKHSARAYRQVRERLGLVTATLAEDIAGMRVVQAFTRETENERNFREVNLRYRAANQRTVILNGLYFPFVDFLSAVATAVVLGYGGYLVFDGSMTAGTLFAFVGYLVELLRSGPAALAALQHVPLGGRGARQDHRACSTRSRRSSTGPARSSCRTSRGTCASRTCASATARAPRCCTASTLDVPAGTTVALVGHTGAGKSTIAKLLARFYDAARGARSRSTARDLRDVTQASLRRQLGVVPQEGFLFAGTVRENIAFGQARTRPMRRSSVRRKTVGAHDFIVTARGRLRDAAAGARHPALLRPAPARGARTGAARRSAHPHPRRGDLVRRHRHRAEDRARRCGCCSRAGRRSSSRTGCPRSATPT